MEEEDEEFEYYYEEDEEDNNTLSNTLSTTGNYKINMELNGFILPKVWNDVLSLRQKEWNEFILLTKGPSEHQLCFQMFRGGSTLMAHFILSFNNKYPLEAPLMEWKEPRYDFATQLLLTLDIKKFSQKEWSIRESLSSILTYIEEVLQDKIPFSERAEANWSEEEKRALTLLHELDYFQNRSYFEEYNQQKNIAGKGIGYSDSYDSSQKISRALETRESEKKNELMAISKDLNLNLPANQKLLECLVNMGLAPKLENYVEKMSFTMFPSQKSWIQPLADIFGVQESWRLKSSMENSMNVLEENPFILLVETPEIRDSSSPHYFKKMNTSSLHFQGFQNLYKRIVHEMMDLAVLTKELDHQLFVVWCLEEPQLMRFVLSSENEPYFGSIFEFHVFFPPEYPSVPPKIQFMTTGGGSVRMNPNLYADGKICLSLLGTWTGEPWNPSLNNMVHVVQAIMAMVLTDQPVMNEPAYYGDEYFDSEEKPLDQKMAMVRKYKFQIRYHSLLHGIIEPLKNTSSIFYPLIRSSLEKKKKAIQESLDKYVQSMLDTEYFSEILRARTFQLHSPGLFEDYPRYLQNAIQEWNQLMASS